MAKKLYSLPGFNRFRFDTNGDCYNAITGEKRKREQWSSGREFVRILNDSGKREVIYTSDIAEKVTAIEKREKMQSGAVKNLKKAGFSNPTLTVAKGIGKALTEKGSADKVKRVNLKESDAVTIHELNAAGKDIQAIATQFNRSKSTIRQILNGSIYPEAKTIFDSKK